MRSKLGVVSHQQGARASRRDDYPFEIFWIALDFDLQLNTQSCPPQGSEGSSVTVQARYLEEALGGRSMKF
jgi:hypothetical protein